MSTSKEQRRQEEVTSAEQLHQAKVQQREQQQSINKALDETKDTIRRTTDEARKDIPHYTQIVNEYQEEETIQAARQMEDNYLESKRNYQFNAIGIYYLDRGSK